MEERDDIIVLINDEGDEQEFEYLDTIEMNENEYVILLPLDEEEGDEGEVVILKASSDEEVCFSMIEDDEELEAVFEEFKIRAADEYDFT